MVLRSLKRIDDGIKSATVVISARNERGNIEAAVRRIPRFTDQIEIIFVEGHSKDGTWEEIQRVIACLSRPHHQGNPASGEGESGRRLHRFRCARPATC